MESSDSCLICLSPSVVPYSPSFRSWNNCNSEWNAVDKDVHVIFLLRHLFEVPRRKLENYLIRLGNPSEWEVSLCSRCTQIVDELKGIYEQLLRINRKFYAAKEKILNLARRRDDKVGGGGYNDGLVESGRSNVLMETRGFMRRHNYKTFSSISTDPFKDGDLDHLHFNRKMGHLTENVEGKDDLEEVLNELICPSEEDSRKFYNDMFLRHNRAHHDKLTNRYVCPLCGKDFSANNKLKFHTMSAHLEELFGGEKLPGISYDKFKVLCSLVFKTEISSLDEVKTEDGMHTCAECKRCFTDKRYLQNHWMHSHYPILALKLKNLQKLEIENLSPEAHRKIKPQVPDIRHVSCNQSDGRTPGPSSTPKASTEMFKCTHCTEILSNPSKLKEHAVLQHPEQFFPPSQFNLDNIPIVMFQASCQLLFRGEDIPEATNGCFSCPLCSKAYFSREPVLVHLVESHYDHMVLKLLKIIKKSTRLPRAPTSTAPPPVEPEVGSHFLFDLTQEPHPYPNLVPPVANMGANENPLGDADGTYISKRKRKDMVHTLKLKCDACGVMFGASSCLSRHKNRYCPVRRAHGLLKPSPRDYNRRKNPPGGIMINYDEGSNLPPNQYYLPPDNLPRLNNFSTVNDHQNMSSNSYNLQKQNELFGVNSAVTQLGYKNETKSKMDEDEVMILDGDFVSGQAGIDEQPFVSSEMLNVIMPDEDPLAM